MYRYNLILIKVFKIKTNSETLSTFIRFEGCNLRCEWCDTAYSWDAGEDKELLSADKINPQEIVEFMKEKNLIDIKLQLQLHKIIWPKECRGV